MSSGAPARSGPAPIQVKPKLGGRAEEMGKAQGRIAGDGALAVENPGDAVGRHLKLARERSGAHIKFFQFFGQVFAWVDSVESHSVFSFSDNQQFPRSMAPATRLATRSKPASLNCALRQA